MPMILSRTEVREVACPKCLVAVGEPCTGYGDRSRDSNHSHRLYEFARVRQLPSWQMEWPRIEHALPREEYRALVRMLPCRNCGAGRGENCRSRRAQGRLSVHRERSQDWQQGVV